jgi:hypothetical protein
MKTVICRNETCSQNGVNEFLIGEPDLVMCGVCCEPCELSEHYADPEILKLGTIVPE